MNLVGGGALIGTSLGSVKALNKFVKDPSFEKEGEDAHNTRSELFNKVKDVANSKGVVVSQNSPRSRVKGSHYMNDDLVKKSYKSTVKYQRDSDPDKYKDKSDDEVVRSLVEEGGPKLADAYKNGKGKIGLNPEDIGHPSAISHELGHAIDQTEGGVGSKVRNSMTSIGGYSSPTSAVTGLLSGINSERLARKGKKEGLISKHSSWAVPVLMNTPTLINEAVASRKGYKVLKDAGATKDQLKNARNTMIGAYGSYASKTIGDVGVGLVSRGLGKLTEKAYYKLKDRRKSKKGDDSTE